MSDGITDMYRYLEKKRNIINELVINEYERATKKFSIFNSTHEGYAVILEELDEAWNNIKKNDRKNATIEMIQVAAMAIRWLMDCGDCEVLKEN